MKGGGVADGPPVKCKLHARHQSLAGIKQPRHTNGARPHLFPSDLDMAFTCFIHINHSHWHTLTVSASQQTLTEACHRVFKGQYRPGDRRNASFPLVHALCLRSS